MSATFTPQTFTRTHESIALLSLQHHRRNIRYVLISLPSWYQNEPDFRLAVPTQTVDATLA
jgi:hypothetical protein